MNYTVKREQYLSKLRQLRDEHIIKVLTGVRRCGKSTIMTMFRDDLIATGVDNGNIVFINFEDPANNDNIHDWRQVYNRINRQLQSDSMNYVFLDEVQTVSQWEKMVDGLYIKPNVDLYITGSNAWFLSSDIATLLSGRYIEIPVLPFSFAEYAQPYDNPNYEQLFQNYMNYGGFPQVAQLVHDDKIELVSDYLVGIINTVMVKDIATRQGVKDTRILTNIMNYMLDNIGSITSAKTIADTLTSNHQSVSRPTVSEYLSAFTDSFLLYSASRYDIKGKKLLQSLEKYYVVDPGLRRAVLGADATVDTGRILENIVYLELLRRGNVVKIGKTGTKEVDFVTTDKSGDTSYYQVSLSVRNEQTLTRELRSLRGIDDNSKYLITLDPEERNFDGIRQVNVVKWLLS